MTLNGHDYIPRSRTQNLLGSSPCSELITGHLFVCFLQGLEKYIMTKLHNWAFGQSAADRERDAILLDRIEALEFVQPTHLDIPDAYQDDKSINMAMAELKKIDHFKVRRSCLTAICYILISTCFRAAYAIFSTDCNILAYYFSCILTESTHPGTSNSQN